jgi:hypothetical protein
VVKNDDSDFDDSDSNLSKKLNIFSPRGAPLKVIPEKTPNPQQNTSDFPMITSTVNTSIKNSEPTAQELERKLEQEQNELTLNYNRKLQQFQDHKEREFDEKIQGLTQKFSSTLVKLEKDITEILGSELNSIYSKLEVDINNELLVFKFPKKTTTDISSINAILENFRTGFEIKLMADFRNLSQEYDTKKEDIKQKIKLSYDKEIIELKEQWQKEGDVRIRNESHELVKNFEDKLEKLQKEKNDKFKEKELELELNLKKFQSEMESKIKQEEEKILGLEAEMGLTYAKKQSEWNQKLKANEPKIIEHNQFTIDSNELILKKLQELSKREQDIEEKEKKLKTKSESLKKESEELLDTKTKHEVAKESFDREMIQFQQLQNETNLLKFKTKTSILSDSEASRKDMIVIDIDVKKKKKTKADVDSDSQRNRKVINKKKKPKHVESDSNSDSDGKL